MMSLVMRIRTYFYELAEFNQLKIWENTSPEEQKEELKKFLKIFYNTKNNF